MPLRGSRKSDTLLLHRAQSDHALVTPDRTASQHKFVEAVGRSHRFTPPKGGAKTMPTGFHVALGHVRFRWVVLGFQGTAGVEDAPNQRGNRQGRGRPAASMNDRCVAVFSMVDSGGNGLADGA